LRKQQASLDWSDAKAMLEANSKKLAAFVEALSEQELYRGPMKGANNQWMPGRWVETAGASHF